MLSPRCLRGLLNIVTLLTVVLPLRGGIGIFTIALPMVGIDRRLRSDRAV